MADKDPQNVGAIIADLLETPGVSEFVIFNYEGIPMRYSSDKWTHQKAVHYAGLVSDFLQVARKLILKNCKNIFANDGDLDYIRLRTKKGIEFIITSDKEFTICVLQRCNPNILEEEMEEGKEGGAPPPQKEGVPAPKTE